jgi:DNA-binding response OmpR family regulator
MDTSKTGQRVLVVDDKPKYIRAIQINLESRGYQVLSAENGASALAAVANEKPDLVLLDLMLPDIDGFEVCRRIRTFSAVPVIMLTARASEADKIRGLDVGADDYLTKPFSANELIARVQAALRRMGYSGDRPLPPVFRTGELEINRVQGRVTVRGQEIQLTSTEYRLLAELAKQAGSVVDQEDLLERVWGTGYEGQNRLLRQTIHRLRQKIEPDPQHPQYVHTRRGLGYFVSLPDHDQE